MSFLEDIRREFEEEGEGDHPDFRTVLQILRNHDPDGRISRQICNRLKEDRIRVQLLRELDQETLKEIIDSWKLNTFGQKTFLIHGVLMNGLKKMRERAELEQKQQQQQQLSSHNYNTGTNILTIISSHINAFSTQRRIY